MAGRKTRRDMLKTLMTHSATLAVGSRFLPGLALPLSFVPFGKGAAFGAPAAPKRKVVFIYLDGGVAGEATADPKHCVPRTLNGSTVTPGYTPERSLQDDEMAGYSTLELAKYALAPGSYNKGEAAFTPPILVRNGIELGSSSGPMLDFADKMLVLRGMTAAPEHSIAARTFWTGADFAASSPRATLDCLIASKLAGNGSGSTYLLPHLAGYRHASVPASIPDDATQIPFPNNLATGPAYAAALLTPLSSLYTVNAPGYLGADLAKQVDAFVDAQLTSQAANVQNAANQAMFATMKNHHALLSQINQNPIGDQLGRSVDAFIQTANTTMNQVVGSAPSWGPSLLAALGSIAFCMNTGLSAVATLNISGSSFDAHGGIYTGRHPALYRNTFYAIGEFLKVIDLTTTTVVVFTEFTRDPFVNFMAGRHHGDSTWCLMFGPHFSGNVFGGTTDYQDPLPVDPATGQVASGANALTLTPAHLAAFLLEMVGYLPGREMQSILGNVRDQNGVIAQAPDFLRKLLA